MHMQARLTVTFCPFIHVTCLPTILLLLSHQGDELVAGHDESTTKILLSDKAQKSSGIVADTKCNMREMPQVG